MTQMGIGTFDSRPPGMAPRGDDPRSAARGDPDAATMAVGDPARLRGMVDANLDFIWRSLRRLGVSANDADDCAQQVFMVAARRLDSIREGSERAFLFSTAMRVASDARRARMRRREVPSDDDLPERSDPGPSPDEIVDRQRARALLDEVLEAMPMDLRAVFVLFELEELGTPEIAKLLEIPVGTAASRLRRAREEFQTIVGRMRARRKIEGGMP
jgi:RNA polymerase sigma-70 factor (ECF subfamily)